MVPIVHKVVVEHHDRLVVCKWLVLFHIDFASEYDCSAAFFW